MDCPEGGKRYAATAAARGGRSSARRHARGQDTSHSGNTSLPAALRRQHLLALHCARTRWVSLLPFYNILIQINSNYINVIPQHAPLLKVCLLPLVLLFLLLHSSSSSSLLLLLLLLLLL